MAGILLAGCGPAIRFPSEPLATQPQAGGSVTDSWDTIGDRQPDYFTTHDDAGRIVRIAYDHSGDGMADSFVDLDAIDPALARHVVIILDGIGYETVRKFQAEGRLRLFHPPVPVISTFPAMTDIALADVFRSAPCMGQEAAYFDHHANRLAGGDADYLSLRNEEWARHADYRAATTVDPLAYLFPHYFLDRELEDLLKLFARRDRSYIVAYVVSVAGTGTMHLKEGQRRVLDRIDRLCQQLVRETRGLVKFTLFSDHGHSLVRGRWVDFPKHLREKDWRVTDRLTGPRDVVPISYGLVTYTSFATRDPAGLAETLLENPATDVAAWCDGEKVIVAGAAGKAVIRRRGDSYCYTPQTGDPLGLVPLIEKARADAAATGAAAVFDADGFASDADWLRLTFEHQYPDALDRLWRCFHGQTEHVPDVIVSLKEGFNAGLQSRAVRFPEGASTHGDLARKNSTAFIMSTAAPVPQDFGPLRMRDLGRLLPLLTGRPWPPRKDPPK